MRVFDTLKEEMNLGRFDKLRGRGGKADESLDSFGRAVEEYSSGKEVNEEEDDDGMSKYWTIAAAGAGLFSDGYVNNSVGSVNTLLGTIYGSVYTNSAAASNVSSIAFAGTVIGQLLFGYVADNNSREVGMMVSTAILIAFTILCACAWGTTPSAMFTALTIYRMFLGIGIGGEYPAGSVACAEASSILGKGRRNRWFIFFTHTMIDLGCVISAIVPFIILCCYGKDNLAPVWRITLGVGAIPPCLLFVLRLKFKESPRFAKYNMKHTRFPYKLIIRFYGARLACVSVMWFLYDFSSYAFGIYFTEILNLLIPDGDLKRTFGWNILLNFFYLPGSLLGAFAADYIGPRLTCITGALLQAIIGFVMAACFDQLRGQIAAFVIIYGLFLTLGEFGPGDQIGIFCSKSCATPIRGQYYGVAAAVGKIGAYLGTKFFPVIVEHAGGAGTTSGNQMPFWIASSLCVVTAFLALFYVPSLTQDSMTEEDTQFIQYLKDNGFDTTKLGNVTPISSTTRLLSSHSAAA
ncbi:MFS phospholipid transporter [Gregarina niphandrodes]|uniref:MFS phospholipid transporter n=1 Tax=Gregarina niphandrodes TaxID=110365 RepID=A0A023BBE1_GRENI|nr:MFS phospholipid transporter [Gregarina niphandrodes]EZG79253.1 MFS phospholipid transporter [Gregarina niphandrodes]|eukprot:XP_011129100.1 MFS phospholipid transporter [Gregarina niphandrodes]